MTQYESMNSSCVHPNSNVLIGPSGLLTLTHPLRCSQRALQVWEYVHSLFTDLKVSKSPPQTKPSKRSLEATACHSLAPTDSSGLVSGDAHRTTWSLSPEATHFHVPAAFSLHRPHWVAPFIALTLPGPAPTAPLNLSVQDKLPPQ